MSWLFVALLWLIVVIGCAIALHADKKGGRFPWQNK